MPKWGLTASQRQARPWGLEPDLLEPDKTITDPIHGDIYVNRLERLFIDSPPLQRLRRIRQLGTTHLVYPGASHTRFSHSLGTLRVAQDLLDCVIEQRFGPQPVRDLFQEWETLPEPETKFAEATVLARLGGLLHDMCHVSFGHSIEDDIRLLLPHDKNPKRYERLWSRFIASPINTLPDSLRTALRPLILSKEKTFDELADSEKPYPFVFDIVGNTICADLIDYLLRDHYYTGLPLQLGHRFAAGFYVAPSDRQFYARRLILRIIRETPRQGTQFRHDAASELYKFLQYRYELSERALVHHAKLAADAQVGKALEIWTDDLWVAEAQKQFPSLVAGPGEEIDALRTVIAREAGNKNVEIITELVRDRLEEELLRRGDDGFLEFLLDISESQKDKNPRMAAVHQLVIGLLNRALYKPIGRSSSAALANATEIFRSHGSPEARRKLEIETARFAELDRRWKVLLWIPNPEMRLKPADVIVDDGNSTSRAVNIDRLRRSETIARQHQELWAVSVFVHPDVVGDQRGTSLGAQKTEIILASLSRKLNVKWEGWEEQPDIYRLIAREIGTKRHLPREKEDGIRHAAENFASSAHSSSQTFYTLLHKINAQIESGHMSV